MSKVKAGVFPQEQDWQKWIQINSGPAINRVFLWRLAAYARDIVKAKMICSWGLRTIERQAIAYQNYLAGGTLAAKPGESWHNFGLAVDVNRLSTGRYPGTINADYDLFMAGKGSDSVLERYGLIHSVKTEPWHIQPVETRGYSGNKAWFADLDDYVNTPTGYPLLQLTEPVRMQGEPVKHLQVLLNKAIQAGLPTTGLFGEQTDDAVQKFQAAKSLTVDGMVGSATWNALTGAVTEVDPLQVMQARINDLEQQLADAEAAKTAALQAASLARSESERTMNDIMAIKNGLAVLSKY